jgi:hypothetical protein
MRSLRQHFTEDSPQHLEGERAVEGTRRRLLAADSRGDTDRLSLHSARDRDNKLCFYTALATVPEYGSWTHFCPRHKPGHKTGICRLAHVGTHTRLSDDGSRSPLGCLQDRVAAYWHLLRSLFQVTAPTRRG